MTQGTLVISSQLNPFQISFTCFNMSSHFPFPNFLFYLITSKWVISTVGSLFICSLRISLHRLISKFQRNPMWGLRQILFLEMRSQHRRHSKQLTHNETPGYGVWRAKYLRCFMTLSLAKFTDVLGFSNWDNNRNYAFCIIGLWPCIDVTTVELI
jgi:hypothetical protein